MGLICGVLPFNDGRIKNIDDNFYNYIAVIIYENQNFYLKIFSHLNNGIKEIDKKNLVEYSNMLEALIDDNSILDYLNKNINNKKDQNPKKTKIKLHDLGFRFNIVKANIISDDEDEELDNEFEQYERLFEYRYHNIGKKNNERINSYFHFDMTYDLKNNGNIILIINFIRSWGNKKLTILLEIDLKNLPYM